MKVWTFVSLPFLIQNLNVFSKQQEKRNWTCPSSTIGGNCSCCSGHSGQRASQFVIQKLMVFISSGFLFWKKDFINFRRLNIPFAELCKWDTSAWSVSKLPDLSESNPTASLYCSHDCSDKGLFFHWHSSTSIPSWNYAPPLCLWHSATGGRPGLPAEEVAKVRDSDFQGTHHECGMSTSPWLDAGLKLPELTPAPWLFPSVSFTRAPHLWICPSFTEGLVSSPKRFHLKGSRECNVSTARARAHAQLFLQKKSHAGDNSSFFKRKCIVFCENTVLFCFFESMQGSLS